MNPVIERRSFSRNLKTHTHACVFFFLHYYLFFYIVDIQSQPDKQTQSAGMCVRTSKKEIENIPEKKQIYNTIILVCSDQSIF